VSDPLAHPLDLPCGAVLENRIAKAAMSERLADNRNDSTAELEALYRRWSQSGAGLILTGNMMVDRRAMEHPGNVAIDGFEDRGAVERLARAATSGGQHAWLQLSHCGRQALAICSPQPPAPSVVRLEQGDAFGEPWAMTEGDILEVIARMARAAKIGQEAGFTGVQVHGAHGYLVSQFLSPRTNLRTDDWGGTLENRARFLLETVRTVRDAVGPDYPVSVKLNSTDFQHDGFTFDDCKEVVRWLNEVSLDLLEISGGNFEQMVMIAGDSASGDARPVVKESTRVREAFFLDYASAVAPVAAMPLMVTGGFRTRAAMEEAVTAGGVDVVGLGRPMCAEPDLPRRLLEGRADGLRRNYERDLVRQFDRDVSSDGVEAVKRGTSLLWFTHQLSVMGKDRAPDVELSLVDALEQVADHEKRLLASWEGPHYEPLVEA